MAEQIVESFHPTGGRVMGVISLVLAAGTVGLGLADRENPFPAPVIWFALLFGALVWASTLRPKLWVTESSLVMRNMFDTVSVPLAAIEQVIVRQVLAVRAGDRRYVSPAVGKSWRQTMKSSRRADRAAAAPVAPATTSYPEFVEERVRHLAEEARAKAGIALMSDEQLALAAGVRRDWAWLEIALVAVTAVGAVTSLVL